MFSIEYEDREVLDYLNMLAVRIDDMTPAMHDIGQNLSETTQRRFDTSTSPDGDPWAPNTEVTILEYLGLYKSSFKKDGGESAKGVARRGSKKPLIGDTGSLFSTIFHDAGRDFAVIGSPMEYAITQQFGARQGQYGRDRRNHPIPWGDIPARPFLGASEEDKRSILDIVQGYLKP